MTDTAPPTTEPIPGEQKARYNLVPMLHAALPWLAFIAAFIAVSHAADVQELATRGAAGQPAAIDPAKRLWLTVPAACAAGLITAIPTIFLQRLIAAAASILAVILSALPGPAFLFPFLAVPIAVIAAHAWFSLKNDYPWRPGAFAASILTLILSYAAIKRQDMFFRLANTTPDPDLGSYLNLAETATGWATTFREPLYVWVLQITDAFGGDLNPLMMRLTGIATALAAIAAIFQMCRKHLNLIVAVIAALIYSGQEYLVYTAVRGLREDLIVCLAILFISIGWSHLRGPVTWKSLTLWGIVAAACSLLRISSFSFVIAVVALTGIFRFFMDIKPWRQRALWLIPIVLTIALMLPYFVHNKRLYNDPFFVVNNAARFFANEEFAGKHPDFPTSAEVAEYAYAGPRITPGEYIFGYHTKQEIAQRTWDGFVKTFFGDIFKIAYKIGENSSTQGLLYVLHFAGIALLLFPSRIYLVLAMLLFHAPVFFLAASRTFDPRLLIMGMVFGYITVASAIGLSIGYAYQYLRPSSTDVPRKPEKPQVRSRSAKRRH